MISYVEQEIFTAREMDLFARATKLVAAAPAKINDQWVRCHELAREVARSLNNAVPEADWPTKRVVVQDGKFGIVEHSWIYVEPGRSKLHMPNILDVYVPGSLPQVQLLHSSPVLRRQYVPLSMMLDDELDRTVLLKLRDIFLNVP